MMINNQPANWQAIKHHLLEPYQLELWIVQPQSDSLSVSGNKQLKLKYHINKVQQQHKAGILTFGGAFFQSLARHCDVLL